MNENDEMDTPKYTTKMSPLYTSPQEALRKKTFIKTHGKDKDGAYRVRNRIQKESTET